MKIRPHKCLKSYLVMCLALCFSLSCYTQNEDSLDIYKKIQKAAYKTKLTTWAYDAIFVPPAPKEYPTKPASKEQKNVNPYIKYKGRIIRNIIITVYDPFGHNVADTVLRPINSVQKFGNRLHITTRHFVIINKLLFKANKPINPLELSETERNLRQSVFINDARIFITKTNSKDSVDVNVVVQDKWPITVPFLLSDIAVNGRFRNQNLFGVGQQFEQFAEFRKPNDYNFNGFYNVANLDNTYISSKLFYNKQRDFTNVGIDFDRPFYSPLSTWAGGAMVAHTWRTFKDTIEGIPQQLPLNSVNYDVWLGKSIKIRNDTSLFSQSTNIIASTRHFSHRYVKRPPSSIDSLGINYNSNAYLGNIGFAVQQYYKDKYIYRFGANEDVPEGLIVQGTFGGLQHEYKKFRYYAGFEIARAKHYPIGYLSTTISYGVFFNKHVPNDITTNLKLYYFSDLKQIGDWYLRQFINFNIVHGENKLEGETITLSGDDLYGFSSNGLSGNTKMVLNSETVTYLPYDLIGFKLAPVVAVGLGMIGSPQHALIQSNLYQGYSLGLMVRNENLLSSTFQISVGMYPFLPNGEKSNRVVYNPITSFTLRVRTFAVSKPDFVSY